MAGLAFALALDVEHGLVFLDGCHFWLGLEFVREVLKEHVNEGLRFGGGGFVFCEQFE